MSFVWVFLLCSGLKKNEKETFKQPALPFSRDRDSGEVSSNFQTNGERIKSAKMKDNLDTLPKESGDQLIAGFKLEDELNILSKENEDQLNTRVKSEDELKLWLKEKEDELNTRFKREDKLSPLSTEKEDELNTRFKREDDLNPWSSLPSLLLSLQHQCASLLILNPTFVPRNLVNALLPRIQTQVQFIKISLILAQKTFSGGD